MTPIKDALEQLLAAWDALPVGDHSIDQVQKWLNGAQLKEAVTAARKALTTPAPGRDALRERIARIIADPAHAERAGYVQGFDYDGDYVIRDTFLVPHLDELHRTRDRALHDERYRIERAKFAADAILSALPAAPVVDEAAPIAVVHYTNWRGETSRRRIIPKSVRYGSTEWHPEPQWLLLAWDDDKQADREFALKDFGAGAGGGER